MSANRLPTAGAVPFVNERGEVSMSKVQVKRYKAGQAPSFANESSDEEGDGVFVSLQSSKKSNKSNTKTQPKKQQIQEITPQPQQQKQTTSTTSRLQKLRDQEVSESSSDDDEEAPRVRRRRREAAVVVTESKDKDEALSSNPQNETSSKPVVRRRPPTPSSDEESSEDEDEVERRRARMRALAAQRQDEEVEQLDQLNEQVPMATTSSTPQQSNVTSSSQKEDDEEDDDSDDESSEYESYTDSDEELVPRLKPVFVNKSKRATIQERELLEEKQELMLKNLHIQDNERREMLRQQISEVRQAEMDQEIDETKLNLVDDDDIVDQEAEEAAWRVRELKRLKRDRDERIALEKERQEIEKLHEMTEEEREEYFKANPKFITNLPQKGKYKFLQKYYHRGAFYLDEEDNVLSRSVDEPTLEDHFDKTVMPKVMQVKKFGMRGRTKYTHLADQDTTDKSSAWAQKSTVNEKAAKKLAGTGDVFDRKGLKRKRK